MGPNGERDIGPEIGPTLRDRRQRLGLEIRDVEERTKIRARYLRALENEDWETLPAPAYVRGFLRSYGQVLGLDGEMLADQYRRRHDAAAGLGGLGAEPVLSEPRRPGERPPSRRLLVLGLIAALVAVLLVLGLLAGGGDESDQPTRKDRREARQERKQQQQRKEERREGKESKPAPLREVELSLRALSPADVCLVARGEALIDRQVLPAGAEETFGGSKRYRLDVVGGGVQVAAGGERRRVETSETASVEADSRGIRSIEYAGPDCP